jgi:stage II sporulation protein E
MGHGDKASEDSKFALYVLKNLIELGMDTKKAIESCNALMYSKSDTYNTLDLLEYDCFSDDIYLYKNGSGNTYIQYDNFVDKLVSENLPLGIIDEINVKKLSIKNDVERILLTSDGINENLTEIISENRNKNVLELVNDIFKINNDAKDDQTIMAINIIKK